eukprot:jgi/Psemu1/19944/gm1.19944_g
MIRPGSAAVFASNCMGCCYLKGDATYGGKEGTDDDDGDEHLQFDEGDLKM